MTEQTKPVNQPSATQQRTGQQPQTGRPLQQRPLQGVPPQANRPQQGISPQANRPHQGSTAPMQRPTSPQGHPMHAGTSHPARQGQMPSRTGIPQRQMGQRPLNTPPYTHPQGSVRQDQGQMQKQINSIPQQQERPQQNHNNQSYQETPISPAQSFLSNSRNLTFILIGAIIFGILLGAMMFGGSSQPVRTGLQNFVKNQDIRQKLPLCGRVVKGQACILYIMNATRYDRLAESFFDEALRLTEVPKRNIEWANPKYAKQRIPPGAFAEIFIPNVR